MPYISVFNCVYIITAGPRELGTPVGTPRSDYHYSITTNTSFSSQQPQGIMQMQSPVVQAAAPTAMQVQNPVMPVQQTAAMQVPQVMQVQQAGMPMMPVQQQTVMPPNQQSPVVHGHQPTSLQIPQQQQQQQQQTGGVGTPLSNIPLSQRIPLLPTPMVGSPSSIPVTQQQMMPQQQVMPSVSTVNTAHYSTTSYVSHNTQ